MDSSNLPMLGLGGAFVAGCLLVGVYMSGSEAAVPVHAGGRVDVADLDTSTSQISRADQAGAVKACTDMMVRRNKSSSLRAGIPSEALPDYCGCIAHGARNQLSRFQFLVMEASFRAFTTSQAGSFLSADNRARSSEITSLGREALRHGLNRSQVAERVEHADRVLNGIARNCLSELPKPEANSGRKGRRS